MNMHECTGSVVELDGDVRTRIADSSSFQTGLSVALVPVSG